MYNTYLTDLKCTRCNCGAIYCGDECPVCSEPTEIHRQFIINAIIDRVAQPKETGNGSGD